MNQFASHAVVVVALAFSNAVLAQTAAPVAAAGPADPPAAAGPAPPAGPTPAEVMPPSAGIRTIVVVPGDVKFRQGRGRAEGSPHRVNA
jgi:hypothetical protein